jgi:hypothetical protein
MGHRVKPKTFAPLPTSTHEKLKAFKEGFVLVRDLIRKLQFDQREVAEATGDYSHIDLNVLTCQETFLETVSRVVVEIDRVLNDETRSLDKAFGLPGTAGQAEREDRLLKLAHQTFQLRWQGKRWAEIVAELGKDQVYLVRNLKKMSPGCAFALRQWKNRAGFDGTQDGGSRPAGLPGGVRFAK